MVGRHHVPAPRTGGAIGDEAPTPARTAATVVHEVEVVAIRANRFMVAKSTALMPMSASARPDPDAAGNGGDEGADK